MSIKESKKICPLCGKDNNCKHGEGSCWCDKVKFPKQLLDLIPDDKKGKVCVCKSCFEKFHCIESIKKYAPYNEQEKKDKEIVLKCFDMFDDILSRENEIAHITSSAFVINKTRDKVLMINHNIYNSWSWTGGHADGESNLLSVAIKEANEETGIKNLFPVTENIISLDVLTVVSHIKRGKYVAPHLHLSVAYLIQADENEKLIVKPDENSGVKWVPINEIESYSNEPHMIKVYMKILDKIKEI